MERRYNELRLMDVFKKRFSEVKNTVGSAGRLRLIVSKGHQRRIDKNNLVPQVIGKQPCSRATMRFSYVVSAPAELCFGIVAHKHSMAGLTKRLWESLSTIFCGRNYRSRPATLKISFGGAVAGLESWSKLEKTGEKLWLRVTGRCTRARREVQWRF